MFNARMWQAIACACAAAASAKFRHAESCVPSELVHDTVLQYAWLASVLRHNAVDDRVEVTAALQQAANSPMVLRKGFERLKDYLEGANYT